MANDQVQHIMAYMRLKAIFERLEGEIRANDYGAQFKTTQELKKKVQRLQSTLPKPI